MGVMLSVLVAGVGAMDLIYCLAYVSNQATEPANAIEDGKQVEEGRAGLEQYRESVRQQLKEAPRGTVEGVTYAQDGVPYRDGYRLEPGADGGARLDELIEKLRILERQSQEKEHQLEQMSVQMSELERSTVEQSLIIEELRSRSVSRAHSVEPSGRRRAELSPSADGIVPQIVLNDPNDSGGAGGGVGQHDEPRASSSKFRPIRRDDGLRRSVKRRSVTSTASLEDRSDELDRLSQLEDEECARMDDYIPIVYGRDEQDPMNRRHNISPIPESCHHHEDDEQRQWVPERSPEPTLAANTTRPWGDIKLGEMKEKAVIRPSRSMSIEEEDVEGGTAMATVGQLHVSESLPSNLSSHSNTPEPEPEPTLRRTTKEADLTSLLLLQQPGAPESQASSSSSRPWTTEIIVQRDDEAEGEEGFDSDGGNAGTVRSVPQFMQSKSPSPYSDLVHERAPLADISNRLVPLVPPGSRIPVSYPVRPRSPTPYDEPGSSRASTTPCSSPPSTPEKLRNGSVSRDNTISPHPASRRSASSSSSSTTSSSSSTRRCAGDLRRSSESKRLFSPLPALVPDAGIEGDTEGESDQLLAVPGPTVARSSGSSLSPSPRRKYKERKRVARSLTPIDFDQTFMDSFSEQHLSVTPSELEDYINSMDEIRFVPPPLVKPSYLYPTPSLLLTDELGIDARFHDDLSSKSFYGQSQAHAGVTPNHRVSYVEWIKKFPDNQTSHLALEDFDSDDEEVETILLFPAGTVPKSGGNSPQQPAHPAMPKTPERAGKPTTTDDERAVFPVNVTPGYATPSPVSLVSDLSELSSQSSHTPSASSLSIGSPLLNGCTNNSNFITPPEHHFTPIVSLSELSIDSDSPLPSLQSPRLLSPQTQAGGAVVANRPTLHIPGGAPSRTPSLSPLPLDISAEEEVFEIGHLDGLIFEPKSREPTPSPTASRNESRSLPLLSPDELAFDIGNMGGLILGPPSRGASPVPPA